MLEGTVNPYTIKAIEAIEGCSMEEFIKKVSTALKLTTQKEQKENEWLNHYLNTLEACDIQELLRIGEASAYQILNHPKCPTLRLGKRMVVPRDAFWKFIEAHQGKRIW